MREMSEPVVKNGTSSSSTRHGRDMIAIMTHRVLAMALEELRTEETRRCVSENLVIPLVKAVLVEFMPYAIAMTAVMAAILLMSAGTLVMFYYK